MAKRGNNQRGKAPRKSRPEPNSANHQNPEPSTSQNLTTQTTSPDANFARGIQIAQILFFCLTQFVTPAIQKFLCRMKLPSPRVRDFDHVKLLKKMFYHQKKKSQCFSERLSNTLIRNAIAARNDICHIDLKFLTTNWKRHALVWISLCRCVGNARAAFRVRVIYNLLTRGKYKHVVRSHAFRLNTGNYNQHTAFGLSFILYGCLTKYIAPALRTFMINTKSRPLSTTYDVFKNLKYLIAEQEVDIDYLATGGNTRNDSALLKLCMKARHMTCHGFNSRIFNQWKSYLQSWIQLMDVIKANDTSAELQDILDYLVNHKQRGLKIRSASILFWLSSFPNTTPNL
ncbi:hypothetical protein GHT06_010046 [Daphnia sinensis]|uniref:Uncharacterized protein n=1 Tax=Daphnia sinensis TaxID=1820382 RepID=A0AAD5PWM3_9CRUS|nr:hypothetical protein GHT06_010046 [Daphnia sinensis]